MEKIRMMVRKRVCNIWEGKVTGTKEVCNIWNRKADGTK